MKLSKLLFTSFTALSILAISYMAVDTYNSINDKIKFKVPSVKSSELNGVLENVVDISLPRVINTIEVLEVKSPIVKPIKRFVAKIKRIEKKFTVSKSQKIVNPLVSSEITANAVEKEVQGKINHTMDINHYGYNIKIDEPISIANLISGTDGSRLADVFKEINSDVAKKEKLAIKEETSKVELAEQQADDKVNLSLSAPEKKYKSLSIQSDLESEAPTSFSDLPALTKETTTSDVEKITLAESKIVEEEVKKYQMKKWAEFNKKDSSKKVVVKNTTKNDKISLGVSTAITRIKSDYSNKRPLASQKSKPVKQIKQKVDYSNQNLVAMRNIAQDIKNPNILTSQKSKLIIQATAVGIGSGFSDFVSSFEFVPKYDNRDSLLDSNGEVIIDELLSSDSVVSGTIRKNGYIDTKVDLSFINNGRDQEINIPFLDKETYDNFLDSKKIVGIGGHLIVELSEDVEDVEIDSKYERKIFLDENFKEADQNEHSQFVLFAGIVPGNALITYALTNQSLSEKIALINEGEVYFDFPEIQDTKKLRVAFNEKTTLGSKLRPAELSENSITFFNTNIKSKEIVPGVYEVSRPNLSTTFRNYLELTHLGESIFIGFNQKDSIEIPDANFIAEAYSMFGVRTLDNACIAQVNLSKELLAASMSGNTYKGGMGTEIKYVEKDGTISDEPSELSSKILVLGELQGVINLKLEYLDDSVQYLQTICSDNTYLVEQL